MSNISVHLPKEIEQEYIADPNKKGLIAKLLAAHYGFEKQPKYVKRFTPGT